MKYSHGKKYIRTNEKSPNLGAACVENYESICMTEMLNKTDNFHLNFNLKNSKFIKRHKFKCLKSLL